MLNFFTAHNTEIGGEFTSNPFLLHLDKFFIIPNLSRNKMECQSGNIAI